MKEAVIMAISIERNQKRGLRRSVEEAISQYVKRQDQGCRLPSENALAAQLGISPKTVNRAYCSLAAKGIVGRHRGSGTYALGRHSDIHVLVPCAEALYANSRIPFSLFYRDIKRRWEDSPISIGGLTASRTNLRTDIDLDAMRGTPTEARVIVWGFWFRNAFEYLRRRKCRVALIHWENADDYLYKGETRRWVRITLGKSRGIVGAIRRLKESGRKRIAFLHDFWHYMDSGSIAFRDAMRTTGLKIYPELVSCATEEKVGSVVEHMALLRKRYPFDGIATSNARLALDAYGQLRRMRIRVPADVAIASFDDQPALASNPVPISAVRMPNEEAMQLAIQSLLAERYEPAEHVLHSAFIARDST